MAASKLGRGAVLGGDIGETQGRTGGDTGGDIGEDIGAASKLGRGAVLVMVQLLPTTASAAPRTVRCMPLAGGSGAGAMLWCWCGRASMSSCAPPASCEEWG